MKVAILKSGASHKGGMEKYAHRLAQAFTDRGCDVTILTSLRRRERAEPEHFAHLPYKVVFLGSQSWCSAANRLLFDRSCQQWLKENPQDVVFGMDRNSHQTHYRVGGGLHIEYLERRVITCPSYKRFTFHLNPFHHIDRSLERRTFTDPNMRAIFTNSHMVRDQILKRFPTPPERLHVVHNGVEWNEMAQDFEDWPEQAPLIKQDLGLDHDRHQFLLIAQGWRRKGLTFLLDGLARLPRDTFQLSVIGREKRPGEYLRQIRRLNLEENVKLFGLRHDVRRFLQMADSVVIPSVYDPFANVTVEALAMGLYVVSSEYNGGKEVLTPDTGVVIPKLDDSHSMATSLAQALLHTKTGESGRLARNGIQHLDFAVQLNKIVETTLKTA